MKVIIAGSRSFADFEQMEYAMSKLPWKVEEVVSGCARGADTLGEKWAAKNGIPIAYFPAEWSKHGRSAGYRRNAEMAEYADAAVLFWDGSSKGTANMKSLMEKAGKQVVVIPFGAQVEAAFKQSAEDIERGHVEDITEIIRQLEEGSNDDPCRGY